MKTLQDILHNPLQPDTSPLSVFNVSDSGEETDVPWFSGDKGQTRNKPSPPPSKNGEFDTEEFFKSFMSFLSDNGARRGWNELI